jgi:pyrroloquinoline quinone (PQQ) biosynthesis protein C
MSPLKKNLSFKKTAEKSIAEVGNIFQNFPWSKKRAYGDWLAQTYYFVAHSTRLLALAAARTSVTGDSLHYRWVEHIKEERGHHRLCLNDLKQLGYTLNDFHEHPQTSAFYQSQYYQVDYVHPKALFGYILLLEAVADKYGGGAYKETERIYGALGSSFLKVHATEDPEHVRSALKWINSFSKEDTEIVSANLAQTAYLYGELLTTIAQRNERTKTRGEFATSSLSERPRSVP